jgi:hypothetical protein
MSISLYEQRRAELVKLIGEDKVREIEMKLMDDYLLYGARRSSGVPLKGIFG